MGLFSAIVCVGFFLLVIHDFCQRLPAARQPKFRRWFLIWAAKGMLAPMLVWVVFDGGVFKWLPPLTRDVPFGEVVAVGLFLIASYWAAVTSAWLLAALGQQTENRDEVKRCFLVWSLGLGPMAALITLCFGWKLAGAAATLWFLPIIQRVLTLQPEQRLKPIYSQALAKMHFDKHEEAEKAILEELEKCEDDFDGWLFLADLYATHFHDLRGAEEIIHQTCDHPNTSASQVAVAFHRLADWHLKLAGDPQAARRDLWEICRRHPKSHLDKMARLRLDQIPASKEQLVESQTPKPYSLPQRPGRDDSDNRTPATLPRAEALARARSCVERLQKNPDDVALREDLARLFAEQLDAVDQGLEQLELLLAMADPPEKKAAHWLLLTAEWKIKYKKDQVSARKLFERIINLYPNTTPAFAAQSQLGLLNAELRMEAIRAKLKLPQV